MWNLEFSARFLWRQTKQKWGLGIYLNAVLDIKVLPIFDKLHLSLTFKAISFNTSFYSEEKLVPPVITKYCPGVQHKSTLSSFRIIQLRRGYFISPF